MYIESLLWKEIARKNYIQLLIYSKCHKWIWPKILHNTQTVNIPSRNILYEYLHEIEFRKNVNPKSRVAQVSTAQYTVIMICGICHL